MPYDRANALDERRSRAELILACAIAFAALLVIALMVEYGRQKSLHARTVETVSIARGVRDETMSIMQALADVEAARRADLLTRGRVGASEAAAAMADVRTHVEALQQHAAIDPEMAAHTSEIATLIERDFSNDRLTLAGAEMAARSVAFRSELRAAMSDLRARVNAINDTARNAERRSREQLDALSIALGVLALVAVALAVLTLRRERARWRFARDVAEAADAAKSRFLAVASHDMRQPLHALTLYLTALERRVETIEGKEILKKMERATQSMTGMFATLLDLARVQAGAVTPELSSVRVQDLIDRILAEHPGGQVDAPPTELSVYTDPMLLERALSNLVANAMKHGGGKCRIETLADGEYVDVSIADDGPGIALDDQARVFDEFVRLDARGADGLGLGLAIVKRISRLLDAPLLLVSAPGQGARFTLRLKRAQTAAAIGGGVSVPNSISGACVLLMDDDALAREAVAGVLRDLGGKVHACANERDVATALDGGLAPDLLVMDLRIDGELQGLDITRRARARLPTQPPAIIITGDTGPETLAMLRASGFRWLIKPVAPDKLMEAVAAEITAAV